MAVGSATGRPTLDVDPFSRESLAEPLRVDTLVRETAPVVWLSAHQVWATGRHDLVEQVFRDWERFTSTAGTGVVNTRRAENWREPSVLLEADPPQHTKPRAVMARVLGPAAVRRLRTDFAATADALVEDVVARSTFDAATDLAEAFPLTVLPDAVGFVAEGRRHLLPYSNLNFQAQGPRNELYEEAVALAGDSPAYVAWQMRREALRPDGLAADIFAAADAGEVTEHEASMMVRSILSAGVDTTIFGIGLTIQALLENPGQWQLLRDDPSLARFAFDESLRYNAPSPIIGRTTNEATELGGIPLGADEKVLLFLGAANRDPRRWEDPDAYRITRRATGHLAFGTGIHGCVGSLLARLEAESLLSALARRVDRLELVGEPRIKYSNWLRGLVSLPVRAHAA
jgi:cytochrome P450